jgi:hypothetical protein
LRIPFGKPFGKYQNHLENTKTIWKTLRKPFGKH